MIMISESEMWIELLFHLIAVIACIVIIILFFDRYRKDKKTRSFYLGLLCGFILFFIGQLLMLYWIGGFFAGGISNWHPPWHIVAILDLSAIIAIGWSIYRRAL